MNVLDLFSGIGGFSLGLERAGMRTVAFCEIEPYCRAVLRKHWPDVPAYGDIKELTGRRLSADGIAADVICGGFPCQDISVAGRGAGLDGERSGLWTEYRRLIEEVRPGFVIIENSPALRTRGADRLLSNMEALGYACEPVVVGAIHAGAPHRRQRVWLIAYADSAELWDEQGRGSRACGGGATVSRDDGAASAVADANSVSGKQGRQDHAAQGTRGWNADRSCVGTDVSNTDSIHEHNGRHGAGALRQFEATDISGREWWASEPDVGRVAYGIPARSHRIKALGNSVVPQITEAIGRALMTVHRQEIKAGRTK